ncbi:ribonuclease H-like domain-containing protein, partial [Tanacetum coccineum]
MSSPVNLSRYLQELLENTRIISIKCRCFADSDSNREEIDIFSRPDDLIPPCIESDFDSEEDIIDNLLNNDPISEYERLTFDIEPDVPVINNVDELNEDECFDPWEGEINVEVDNSFTFVTQTFLLFLTYLEVSPLLASTKNEDTILTPASPLRAGGISLGWKFHDEPKFSEVSRARCYALDFLSSSMGFLSLRLENIEDNTITLGWIIDSGANQHLTTSTIGMINIVDISNLNITVGYPNGSVATISHVGDLRLSNNVILYDVLVVPGLGQGDNSGDWTYDIVDLVTQLTRAKQTREPFPLSDHKSEKPGELVHLDLWGPYRVSSREGFKYFLTIVDDYSRAPFFSLKCDKLTSRSEKCVLIGYSPIKKAYKLLSLDNRSVLFSRDVRFYETVFKFKMKNTKRNDLADVEYTSDAKLLTFFDNQIPPSPNDEERAMICVKTHIRTDIAKISRKRSKPDKHEHGKGKRIQEPEECFQSNQATPCVEGGVHSSTDAAPVQLLEEDSATHI